MCPEVTPTCLIMRLMAPAEAAIGSLRSCSASVLHRATTTTHDGSVVRILNFPFWSASRALACVSWDACALG